MIPTDWADGWTVGCELEWPDIDNRCALPAGWSWSETDYSIINSSGWANDPKRILILEGGELNTPAFPSALQLAEAVELQRIEMQPTYNYRSNFHVHVKVPWLASDLETVKRIALYSRSMLPHIWPQIDPLQGLLVGQATLEDQAGAQARLRHSQASRHTCLKLDSVRHRRQMEANTLEEFLAWEVPWSEKQQRPQWHLASREAVNLRSLRKHGTVEFRCFANPETLEQTLAAIEFSISWLKMAIGGAEVLARIVMQYSALLPRQLPYDHRLELGWRATNLEHHSRSEIAGLLLSQEKGVMEYARVDSLLR